jgi:xanthine dehydrogenase accessory factor
MNNHLMQLLRDWYPLRDKHLWVLGTVYKTEGPCYRKAGAMMLFNDLGQQFGLLSGGCLEADIQRQAARVMRSKTALTLTYDGSDEDDISFQLGIGCGGTVHILLQPILPELNYLSLDLVHDHLSAAGKGFYRQLVTTETAGVVAAEWHAYADIDVGVDVHTNTCGKYRAELVEQGGQVWLQTPLSPPPHLLIVGGGVDAQPMVALAKNLGWTVTVWDSRPANARRDYFLAADHILRQPLEQLLEQPMAGHWDAAVVMSHNLQMDAEALKRLQGTGLNYLALLGPASRRQQVLQLAQLDSQPLAMPIASPAGFDLGAELPEGIALSILAECHAVLQGASGQSLNNVLTANAQLRETQ